MCPRFMREGLSGDDIWVMVEDEFVATARLFTQHLHHAEYKRLKQLAKTQNASKMQSISRPVDSRLRLSAEAKKRMKATQVSKDQEKALGIVNDGKTLSEDEGLDELEDDEPWGWDPRLSGLMKEPKQSTARLASLTGTKSRTKAAAGFSQPHSSQGSSVPSTSQPVGDCPKAGGGKLRRSLETHRDGQSSGEDDLDAFLFKKPAAPRLQQPMQSHQPEKSPNESLQSQPQPPHLRQSSSASKNSISLRSLKSVALKPLPRAPTTTPRALSRHTSPIQSESVPTLSVLDDIPRRQQVKSKYAERLAKRKADKAREKKDREKPWEVAEIPTFLF